MRCGASNDMPMGGPDERGLPPRHGRRRRPVPVTAHVRFLGRGIQNRATLLVQWEALSQHQASICPKVARWKTFGEDPQSRPCKLRRLLRPSYRVGRSAGDVVSIDRPSHAHRSPQGDAGGLRAPVNSMCPLCHAHSAQPAPTIPCPSHLRSPRPPPAERYYSNIAQVGVS